MEGKEKKEEKENYEKGGPENSGAEYQRLGKCTQTLSLAAKIFLVVQLGGLVRAAGRPHFRLEKEAVPCAVRCLLLSTENDEATWYFLLLSFFLSCGTAQYLLCAETEQKGFVPQR